MTRQETEQLKPGQTIQWRMQCNNYVSVYRWLLVSDPPTVISGCNEMLMIRVQEHSRGPVELVCPEKCATAPWSSPS